VIQKEEIIIIDDDDDDDDDDGKTKYCLKRSYSNNAKIHDTRNCNQKYQELT
jgi:hypothetical protein